MLLLLLLFGLAFVGAAFLFLLGKKKRSNHSSLARCHQSGGKVNTWGPDRFVKTWLLGCDGLAGVANGNGKMGRFQMGRIEPLICSL